MIVWTGRGFLSILILILTMFICISIFPKSFSEYGFIISLYVAGIFSYFFGIKWNHKNLKTYISKETGREVNLVSNHSLFWVKMQYWGIIFIVLGIIILVQNLYKGGIELYLNIFLGLLGIVCFVFFSVNLFKNNTEGTADTSAQNKSSKTTVENVAIPKFDRVEMKEIKSDDHNRFLPK